jgi:CRP/FNR family transcriptional regulator, cyclic AMP receptor protein
MSRAVESLAKTDLFGSMSPEEIRALDSRCIWRRAKAKQWILEYCDDSKEVFFLTSGRVRVVIQSVGGREIIFRDIEAGDFFGELAAIDGQSRSAGIVALSDATIARMTPSTFVDTITRNPAVAKRVLVRMAGQARALVDRVREFDAMGIHERLVTELLRMSQVEEGEPGRAVVSPPPTHAHLAGLVGTRRDSISKELRQMRKVGLIEARRDALVLPDVQRIMRELSTKAIVRSGAKSLRENLPERL